MQGSIWQQGKLHVIIELHGIRATGLHVFRAIELHGIRATGLHVFRAIELHVFLAAGNSLEKSRSLARSNAKLRCIVYHEFHPFGSRLVRIHEVISL